MPNHLPQNSYQLHCHQQCIRDKASFQKILWVARPKQGVRKGLEFNRERKMGKSHGGGEKLKLGKGIIATEEQILIRNGIQRIKGSGQFSHSVVSDSLRPHELQHTRPPCPSPTSRVHSDSRPLSQ